MNDVDIVQAIEELTHVYEELDPSGEVETFESMLTKADQLKERVDEMLRAMSAETVEPTMAHTIHLALIQAYKASLNAMNRVQSEKEEIGCSLNQLKVNNKARQAYSSPAIGMGFTEGNFIDSKK